VDEDMRVSDDYNKDSPQDETAEIDGEMLLVG
jgi:hypothetical protein